MTEHLQKYNSCIMIIDCNCLICQQIMQALEKNVLVFSYINIQNYRNCNFIIIFIEPLGICLIDTASIYEYSKVHLYFDVGIGFIQIIFIEWEIYVFSLTLTLTLNQLCILSAMIISFPLSPLREQCSIIDRRIGYSAMPEMKLRPLGYTSVAFFSLTLSSLYMSVQCYGLQTRQKYSL